jgi:PAS domain S-box-containing protein
MAPSRTFTDLNNVEKERRIEEISKLIIEIASGNFDAQGIASDERDDLDAIVTGINMLGEELKASTVSRDYLKSIFRGIVDMMIILNPDNTIREINQTVADLLLYKEEDLIGYPVEKIFAKKKNGVSPLIKINNQLQGKGYCYNIERSFRTREGKKIYVSCSASHLYDVHGNITGILYIAKDISKLKKTEAELKIKNKELDTFVYRASHDLKGPLVSIIGLTQMVKQEVKDPIALEFFDMINKSTNRLADILKNLMEIAIIEKVIKEKELINLEAKITEVIESLRHGPYYNGIKIELDIKIRKKFYCNNKMLTPVLQNLIDNALKYKNDDVDSYLHIKASEFHKGIQIIMEDNGIGIEKSIQAKIFDMFFRGTIKAEGSGLGLYTVRSFIQKMGGDITVQSKEGHGTTFIIYLPNMDKI